MRLLLSYVTYTTRKRRTTPVSIASLLHIKALQCVFNHLEDNYVSALSKSVTFWAKKDDYERSEAQCIILTEKFLDHPCSTLEHMVSKMPQRIGRAGRRSRLLESQKSEGPFHAECLSCLRSSWRSLSTFSFYTVSVGQRCRNVCFRVSDREQRLTRRHLRYRLRYERIFSWLFWERHGTLYCETNGVGVLLRTPLYLLGFQQRLADEKVALGDSHFVANVNDSFWYIHIQYSCWAASWQ